MPPTYNKPATYYVDIQGKMKHGDLYKPNDWNAWNVVIYPTPASLDFILTELKNDPPIKNEIRKDDDGTYVKFSRRVTQEIRGLIKSFNPPEIMQADGLTPLRGVYVGNGSDITAHIQVYYILGGKGRAARLESIRVDNLVPFEISKDFNDDQKRMVKGLDKVPQHPF